jgi:uncharacterized protein (TIGR00730 family)
MATPSIAERALDGEIKGIPPGAGEMSMGGSGKKGEAPPFTLTAPYEGTMKEKLKARCGECECASAILGAMTLKRVAVYCGSASGNDAVFLAEASALGRAIAAAGLGMVYGGASVGLMGAVADAALAGGAEVIGVLPEILSGSEIAHRGLTRLEMVPTMHERKARMVKLADAFLMLPGGYGTLDEMMEIVTWKQLRLHAKPCILINTSGYWDALLAFLDRAVEAGFLKAENRRLLEVAATAEEAVRISTGNSF